MDGGQTWDGRSLCAKYMTLKRGLLLAFCYTFVCLLYVSVYYTEPYTSSNYGSNQYSAGTEEEGAIVVEAEKRAINPKVTLTTASPVDDPLESIGRFEMLKPNSTGMPWANYKKVLTNESVTLHCRTCAMVSSSGQLLGKNAGRQIDAHDCIIRMNDAPVKGFEQDVGSRTTVRLVGHTNIAKTFGANLDLQMQLFEGSESRTERVVVHFFQNTEVDRLKEFEIIRQLAIKYPKTEFDVFTSDKMKFSEELFLRETGISRSN